MYIRTYSHTFAFALVHIRTRTANECYMTVCECVSASVNAVKSAASFRFNAKNHKSCRSWSRAVYWPVIGKPTINARALHLGSIHSRIDSTATRSTTQSNPPWNWWVYECMKQHEESILTSNYLPFWYSSFSALPFSPLPRHDRIPLTREPKREISRVTSRRMAATPTSIRPPMV